jgi:hypothetical protein
MDAAEYCREIEAHLCRRNGGHLVRLVGPAFECVQRWIALGIPFKVACQGIDRHVERASARGTRRRPVRLEFCEADVLDAFDAWRRAVGLTAADAAAPGDEAATGEPHAAPRHASLPAHLARAIARLTALRTGPGVDQDWSNALEEAARRIDALTATGRRARGSARDAVVGELAAIDEALVRAAARLAPAEVKALADAEAAEDLAPYRGRLPADDFASALERARVRALRMRLGLPQIAFD